MRIRQESRTIAQHALTVLAGQLAVMAFGVTDTIVAGRHSPQALAALSVGASIYISVFVSLMGVFQALLPLWGELRGAARVPEIGRSLHQSLYLWVAASVLGMALLLHPGALLRWAQVPQEMLHAVRAYLAVLAWSLPLALILRLYGTLNQALGHPHLVTLLQILSLALKVPLSIWLVFGGLGVPALGVVGCAWASLLVQAVMAVLVLALLHRQRIYAPLALWQRPAAPNWRQLAQFVRLGVPAGLAILVEITSFTVMALFIARQGTVSSASHQIAANVAALCYMVPLSLAVATSARVSYWRGAGNEALARALVWLGFRRVLAAALLLAACLFFARTHITALYSNTPEVVLLAARLLAWVALFQVADGVQGFCIFVLRCWRITLAPLLIYCLFLWGGGLGGGYWMAYHATAWLPQWLGPGTPMPFFASAAAALLLTAAVFCALVHRVTRRMI